MLVEQNYNLSVGFEAIAPQLPALTKLEQLQQSIEKTQTCLAEFSILQWLTELGGPIYARDLELTLWRSTVALHPKPDVALALEQLSQRGMRAAAITNTVFSAHCVTYELEKHGLLKYFEFVISSADLGVRKPHSKPFLFALDKSKLLAHEVVYIGDNLDADIAGSQQAGLTPILFRKLCKNHDWKISPQLFRTFCCETHQ